MDHNDFGISKEQFDKDLVYARKIWEANNTESHENVANAIQNISLLWMIIAYFGWGEKALIFPSIIFYVSLIGKLIFLSKARNLWKEIFLYCVEQSKLAKKNIKPNAKEKEDDLF